MNPRTDEDMKRQSWFVLAIFMAAIPFLLLYVGFTTEEFRQTTGSYVWLIATLLTFPAMKYRGWNFNESLSLFLFAMLFGPVALISVLFTIPFFMKIANHKPKESKDFKSDDD